MESGRKHALIMIENKCIHLKTEHFGSFNLKIVAFVFDFGANCTDTLMSIREKRKVGEMLHSRLAKMIEKMTVQLGKHTLKVQKKKNHF